MKLSAAHAWRLLVAVTLTSATPAWGDEEPLHAVIDRHLAPISGIQPERSSDAEFLRRASIDLIGMPPSADEARAFIAEQAPDKRERLLDRLFASPQFARHLATVLDLILMERRPYVNVSAEEWQGWLLKSVKENKPWNVLVREILAADGEDPAQRAPARFALDRGSEPNLMTRDIGRIFFGRDMQCAQCHDHPLVPDYLQSDYHGLLAFVSPSYALVRNLGGQEKMLQAERAGSDLTFESVFIKTPRRTGARMPDGVVIDEPFFLPGDEYQTQPAENVKAVPKFSRRARLAELATNGSNQAFNENIVNRLWTHMFGRGLVHPVDMHHPDNPPTHPELLELLGRRFAEMKFDIRAFLRELALTSAYQRSFDLPKGLIAAAGSAAAEIAELERKRAELTPTAEKTTEEYEAAMTAWQEAESALLPAANELESARKHYLEAKQKVDEAIKALIEARAQVQLKHSVAMPVEKAAADMEKALQVVPDDAQLRQSAQTIAARSQELTAELAAARKTLEEKTAAVGPAAEALGSATPGISAALARLTPLQASLHQAEEAMVSARRRARLVAEALAAVERRLETARRLCDLPPLQQAVIASQEVVSLRESELAAAQQRLDDQATTVAQGEAAIRDATEKMNAAKSRLATARQEHEKAKAAGVIAAAFVSAVATRPMAFDDTMLPQPDGQSGGLTSAESSSRQLAEAVAAEQSASEALLAAQKALEGAQAEYAARCKAVEAAKSALEAAQSEMAAKQSNFDAAVADLTDRWTNDFTVAPLKPLTPEQLCWAVLRATGIYDRQWKAESVELEKSQPLTEEQKKDPAQVAAREAEIEQRTFDKLKGNVATFITYYGAGAGQPQGDFFATADQALFAANGGTLNSWVAPAEDNVTDRIIKQSDPRVAVEELYLALLTRMPTAEELENFAKYLSGRGEDKATAAQELVWGLLNSAEFRFNH